MGSIYLRKYGVATTIDFCLYELDGTDLKVDAASASGDIKIMKDEGAEANLTADAFVDEGTGYSLAISATEMQAARIVIYIVDQTSPKTWLDKVLIIETYGNASAQHAFDLNTATVNLSAASEAQIDAIETDTNEIQGKLPTNKIMGSSVVTDKDDEIDAIKAKTDTIPANPATEAKQDTIIGYIDTEVAAILAAVDTEVAAIKAKTDTIPANPATEAKQDTIITYIDTEVAAIKAVTDTLSLAAIADAVCDEALAGHSTADSVGLAVKNLLKIGKNKWAISGTTFTIYNDDGTTPLYTFTLDSGTEPTSRTPA